MKIELILLSPGRTVMVEQELLELLKKDGQIFPLAASIK